ncbi:MAG TPA: cytochrome c oxidase subunit II [Gaiellaceae bacterium]
MRRSVFVLSVAIALVLAGTALAGNGGVAPPAPASPTAHHIRSIYWLILGFTGAIFLLVSITLVVFLIKYRSRGRAREVEGPQVRGHTNLELAWTAGPVVILAIIAGFVFWQVSNIGGAPGSSASAGPTPDEQIRVEGHQYYWEYVYPNGAISINTLRLPVDRTVQLKIVSADVAHSWWVPSLAGKLDAIPGKTNFLSFKPTKQGRFRGQCAEFCGLYHARMLTHVEVVPGARYDHFVRQRAGDAAAVGREEFQGVCATCHGLAGQGGYGPNIAANPILTNKAALTKLLREGGIKMPAVGNDWSDQQIDALVRYVKERFQQGGSGGGQG